MPHPSWKATTLVVRRRRACCLFPTTLQAADNAAIAMADCSFNRPIFLIYICSSIIVTMAMGEANAEGFRGEATRVAFNRDIRPIISDKCFQCHGPDAQARKAKLRLDRREDQAGVRGAASVLEAGDTDNSELLRRITHADAEARMPPAHAARQLTADEVELLKRWVREGAKYESHWAFTAPTRPDLPAVKNTTWPHNGIDHFVLYRLEREGIAPSPPADASNLVRRVSLDLIGLPPELNALSAVADRASYEQFVDELLVSPRYGEHWATMWLDSARYADTNGYNNDTPRYNWPYRDWVIEAFNQNMPYDQFVTEQIAGDLLPNPTTSQRIASGFNRNHNITSEGGIIYEEYRLEYVADRVHTTATVFMGLTMRCARCHDHKFDPISQREYYEVFAFFNQMNETGYHHENVGNPPPVIQLPSDQQAMERGEIEKELAQCQEALSRLRGELDEEEQKQNDELTTLAELEKKLTEKRKALDERIPSAMVMQDVSEMRSTYLLQRGAYDQPADEVAVGVPAIFPPLPTDAPQNRLGFAKWLLSPEHPLTSRVIVNRLWAEIFGRGLAATLEDFGTQGESPTHPELLDWLAVELIDSGWDLHHVLRLIVTSSTYRQAAMMAAPLTDLDPDNKLLTRGPRFRLKAEVIRDSALSVSQLLVHKLGGPSIRPYQPAGLWMEVAVGDDKVNGGPYVQSKGDDLYRRSVYMWWKRTCPPPNLNTLDAPEREFCRVQRSRTNTPLQALVLLNDPTFVEAARKLAERMIFHGGDQDQSRLSYGFRLATARIPAAAELELLGATLEKIRQRFAADADSAAKLLSIGDSDVAALNQPELAAYTTIASMLMNLDEFVTK